jgi:WD40 repeat protein
LASGSQDSTVKLWDAETWKLLETLTFDRVSESDSTVMSVVFSPDGARLAAASWDGTAMVWNQEDTQWAPLAEPIDVGGLLYDLAFYERGSELRLVTAGYNGLARVWDAATGAPVGDLIDRNLSVDDGERTHEGKVSGVALSPDGRLLATASRNGIVKLWTTAGDIPQFHRSFRAHRSGIWDVGFGPASALLATAGEDSTVKLWDVDSQEQVGELRGHTFLVRRLAFNKEGTRLASVGLDGLIKVWDLDSKQELLSLSGHVGPVRGVTFSPDGRRLVSGGNDATVRVFTLDLAELLRLGCARVTRNLTEAEWALYVGPDLEYRATCVGGVPRVLASP